MLHDNHFQDLCVTSVTEAFHNYVNKRDISLFYNRAIMKDIPMIGVITPTHSYTIVSEHYQGYVQTPTLCMIHAELLVNDISRPNSDNLIINATVLCSFIKDTVKYSSVHISKPKKQAVIHNPHQVSDAHYYNLLCSMYDVIMEYRLYDNVFSYDKDQYKKLFHCDSNFVTMDQWFWDICSNHILPEDTEKMDIFREVDIKKRIKKKKYTIEKEVRIKRDDTDSMWIKIIFIFQPDKDVTTIERVFILINDYTAKMEDRMTNILYATTDPLTQIWNRRQCEELVSNRILETGEGLFAVFDIDNFKDVNDIFGHLAGDEVLKRISSYISSKINDNDVFGRLGGDEFVLYLYGEFDDALKRFADIIENATFIYAEDNAQLMVSCSAGVTAIKDSLETFTSLYKSADVALYQAKRAGKNNYKVK